MPSFSAAETVPTSDNILTSVIALSGKGILAYTVDEFVKQIKNCPSEDKLIDVCRRKVMGTRAAHEFIIAKFELPGNNSCYLRIDRRPESGGGSSPSIWLLSSAVKATDTVPKSVCHIHYHPLMC